MIAWMAYAALIGALIAAGAFAVERLAVSQGKPRRFVWLAALTLAVVVPMAGGLREPSSKVVLPAAEPTEPAALETATMEAGPGSVPSLLPPASRATARTAGIAWVAGSTAVLAVLCTILVAMACARRRWPPARVDGMDVHPSRRFGPALVGIVAPKPVIPSWVLQEEPAARAAILRHEQEHARARDHLALLYAGLVAAAFPWSPAIWWICRRLRAAIEIDCDQRVIAGGIDAADYGAVLLQAGARSHGRWGFAPAMSQPTSTLERRLRTMSEKTKKLNAAHGVLLATAGLLALGIACDMPAPTQLEDAIDEVVAGDHSPDIGAVGSDANPPPLVLVDGIPMWAGVPGTAVRPAPLSLVVESLEVGDRIRSIQIIKGSEFTATYGEEAANGVINITTRGDAHGSGFTFRTDELTSTPEGFTAKGVSLTPTGFTVKGTSHDAANSTFLTASWGTLTFTTKPGESLRYEIAGRGNWFADATRGKSTDLVGQGDSPVLALANDLLESPEVLRGAILFKDGEILSRIAIIWDDEG
jgi:beta-lactamase regulating signal transducer with metallopeptidase domain